MKSPPMAADMVSLRDKSKLKARCNLFAASLVRYSGAGLFLVPGYVVVAVVSAVSEGMLAVQHTVL